MHTWYGLRMLCNLFTNGITWKQFPVTIIKTCYKIPFIVFICPSWANKGRCGIQTFLLWYFDYKSEYGIIFGD